MVVSEAESGEVKFQFNDSLLTDVYAFEDAFIIVG